MNMKNNETQNLTTIVANRKRKRITSLVVQVMLLILVALIVATPIIWGILTSFKPEAEVASYPPKVVGFSWTWENYVTIFNGGIGKAFLMSFSYALTTVVVDLLVGNLAAYTMSRHKFRAKKLLFYVILAGIPLSSGSVALIIADYIYFSKLHMIDSWFTLTLISTVYHLPMSIWVLKGGMDNIPIEIEEAAAIDGCPRWKIILSLIPKLNRPAIASSAILGFVGVWNEFIVASVMINSSHLRPLQLAIYNFMGFFGLRWGPLCAAATVSIVIVLLIFTVLGKQLVSGLTKGAVKG